MTDHISNVRPTPAIVDRRLSEAIARTATTRRLYQYPNDLPTSKILLQTCQAAEELGTPVTEMLGLGASQVLRLEGERKEVNTANMELWEGFLPLNLAEANHDHQLATRALNKEGKEGLSRGRYLGG